MSTKRYTRDELLAEIQRWNQRFPVGTEVRSVIYPDGVYRTRTEAVALFDQKPVIYLEGFNGYFDLHEIHPVQDGAAKEAHAEAPAPAAASEPPVEPIASAPSATAAEAAPAIDRERVIVVFPGQGAQAKGMGRELFDAYPDETEAASRILGYSIRELCLEDPDKHLNLTQYTQPALYVVNALGHRQLVKEGAIPEVADAYAGHSLGEYNALLAASVFDFETGLRLVVKRGQLMSQASGGGMAAVVGVDADRLRAMLDEAGLESIDLANFNTPAQIVISGPVDAIDTARQVLRDQKANVVPLRVSAAFHSRYMREAQENFADFLRAFEFRAPKAQVVANATAQPYDPASIPETLSRQIASPVRWSDSIAALAKQGPTRFVEVGSKILTRMIEDIRKTMP